MALSGSLPPANWRDLAWLSCSAQKLIHAASLVAQLVKNPSVRQETWVLSPGWDNPLEKGKAQYSLQYSGLENPMDYRVHGSQRVGHD